MSHWLEIILLGMVQGVAEFLPVSSSGHLVLAQRVLGLSYPGITLEVALHCGTLVAVLLIYGRDCGRLAAAVLRRGLRKVVANRPPHDMVEADRISWAANILLASLVTGAVVAPALQPLRETFDSLAVVCAGWILTGLMLLATRLLRPAGRRPGVKAALLVGLLQGLAAVPGISRSGVTIAGGMFAGLSGEDAARFSFLLSIPVIVGAAILDLPAAFALFCGAAFWADAAVAAGVAAAAGYLALRVVLRRVQRAELYRFAHYLLPTALGVTVWQLIWHLR